MKSVSKSNLVSLIKTKVVSIKKMERIAVLSLENSLRLHFDSILLYNHESYPSSFQLSVLALEELGKAKALENFIWNLKTHGNKRDADFERKFIERLYYHPWKQSASICREAYDFSKKYIEFVEKRGLENKKQKAVYVGLEKINGKIDFKGKVSSPYLIKLNDAKKQISLLNDIYKEVVFLKNYQEIYFDIRMMDNLMDKSLNIKLNKWPYRSGLKLRKKFILRSSKGIGPPH